jgi:hypothetical protein
MYYLLCDGIYLDWSIFIKTINNLQGLKRKHCAKRQKSIQKDIEKAFGVMQAQWHMLLGVRLVGGIVMIW